TAGVLSLLLSSVSPDMPYWLLALGMSVANLGLGVTASAMTAALVEAAGPANASVASATFNAIRQVGTLIGVAVAGTVLVSFADWYAAAGTIFIVAGIAYLVALCLALRVLRRSEKHDNNSVNEERHELASTGPRPRSGGRRAVQPDRSR